MLVKTSKGSDKYQRMYYLGQQPREGYIYREIIKPNIIFIKSIKPNIFFLLNGLNLPKKNLF